MLNKRFEIFGGREGIRTPGLLVANEALSQLSYSPPSSEQILAEAKILANRVRSWVTRKEHQTKRGADAAPRRNDLNGKHYQSMVDPAWCPSAALPPCARSHTVLAPAEWRPQPSALVDRPRAPP